MIIARVLLREYSVLVFDEATSSLDYDSESSINKIVEEIEDQTVIVIAHRLSTILSCDNVVVMDRGQIVGQGTHKELLDTCNQYRKLFYEQYNLKDTKTG